MSKFDDLMGASASGAPREELDGSELNTASLSEIRDLARGAVDRLGSREDFLSLLRICAANPGLSPLNKALAWMQDPGASMLGTDMDFAMSWSREPVPGAKAVTLIEGRESANFRTGAYWSLADTAPLPGSSGSNPDFSIHGMAEFKALSRELLGREFSRAGDLFNALAESAVSDMKEGRRKDACKAAAAQILAYRFMRPSADPQSLISLPDSFNVPDFKFSDLKSLQKPLADAINIIGKSLNTVRENLKNERTNQIGSRAGRNGGADQGAVPQADPEGSQVHTGGSGLDEGGHGSAPVGAGRGAGGSGPDAQGNGGSGLKAGAGSGVGSVSDQAVAGLGRGDVLPDQDPVPEPQGSVAPDAVDAGRAGRGSGVGAAGADGAGAARPDRGVQPDHGAPLGDGRNAGPGLRPARGADLGGGGSGQARGDEGRAGLGSSGDGPRGLGGRGGEAVRGGEDQGGARAGAGLEGGGHGQERLDPDPAVLRDRGQAGSLRGSGAAPQGDPVLGEGDQVSGSQAQGARLPHGEEGKERAPAHDAGSAGSGVAGGAGAGGGAAAGTGADEGGEERLRVQGEDRGGGAQPVLPAGPVPAAAGGHRSALAGSAGDAQEQPAASPGAAPAETERGGTNAALPDDPLEELPPQPGSAYSGGNAAALQSAASPFERLDRNIAAIRALAKIESEKRWDLTDAEKNVLEGFSGFGGISLGFLSARKQELLDAGMTADEYEAACASSLTGYYTHTAVIDAIESRLASFGFRDAQILEPSCGAGKFIGRIPAPLAAPGGVTGVELDPLSARIAARLYPQSHIISGGFQQTTAENHYDLVIGNVPFGSYRIFDQSSPEISDKPIHNYFFHKALKEARPGGVVALVTSSWTMDSADARNRLELARKASFLGAVRLPASAFGQSGTDVCSDVIFLQKRPRELSAEEVDLGSPEFSWIGTREADLPKSSYGEIGRTADFSEGEKAPARLNNYFADHPEMAAGTLVYGEDRFKKPVCRCVSFRPDRQDPDDLHPDRYMSRWAAEKLSSCLSQIKCGSIELQEPVEDLEEKLDPAVLNSEEYSSARPYTFYAAHDGSLMYKERPGMMPRRVAEKPAGRNAKPAPKGAVVLPKGAYAAVSALIPLRSQFDLIRSMESQGRDPQEIMPERERLSSIYEGIRAEFGSKADNDEKFFKNAGKGKRKAVIPYLLHLAERGVDVTDASLGRLTYLESASKNGEFEDLAPIFTRMSMEERRGPSEAKSPEDALALSVNEKGRVDPAYMGGLLGKDPALVLSDLRSRKLIYRDPDQVSRDRDGGMDPMSGWVTADEYLSGNIYRRIDAARDAAAKWDSDEFSSQIPDLEAVKPAPLTASQISAEPGAHWIPAHYYSDFINDLLKKDGMFHGTISFNPSTGLYVYENISSWNISHGGENVGRYGVPDKEEWSGLAIWMKILNKQKLVINNPATEDRKETPNPELTAVAMGKAREIEAAFQNWIFADRNRREDLVERYNRTINAIRPRRFDGSGLRFEGLNPAITLRPHQKNAVARSILGGNALFAHAVGAGKTFAMAASAMEKIRLGLAHKAMVVVPKPLLKQEAADFAKLYPGARILVPGEGDFSKAGRRNFMNMVAFGDSQIVFVTKEQFAKIPLSLSARDGYFRKQIEDLDRMPDEAEGFSGKGSMSQRRLIELRKQRLRTKLLKNESRMASKTDEAAGMSFEDMGIDALYVDEAHNYKNAYLESNDARIETPAPSAIAEDMQMKCGWLNARYGNKAIVFATGTPLNNSLVDLFTMQSYLNMPALKDAGVDTLDSFMSTFGVIDEKAEVDVTGQSMVVKTRLRSITNVPEAMKIFGEVADIKTISDISGSTSLPNVTFHYVSTPATRYQRKILKTFASRAEAIRSGSVKPSVDNMLNLSTDGRKLSLDPRLYDPDDPEAADDPRLKVNQCASRVWKIAQENPGKAQVIFCDYGTPSDKGFNIYAELKRKLVGAGMKPEEIAFVHSYDEPTGVKKQQLFDDFNAGKFKVLIGSTSKLGTGCNIQRVLKAVHHLDINWKPSDIEQRNGRIIRDGNTNPDVDVYFYIASRTFDSFMFQTVMRKADSFNKVLQGAVHGDQSERSLDFDGDEAVSYSQCMSAATGNPLWGEQAELSNDVKTLELQEKAYRSHLSDLREEADSKIPGTISRIKKIEASLASAVSVLDAHKPELGRDGGGKEFMIQIAGSDGKLATFTDRSKALAALNARLPKMGLDGHFKRIASWCGIDVYARIQRNEIVDIKRSGARSFVYFGELSLRDARTGAPILTTEDLSAQHRLSLQDKNQNLGQIAAAFDGLRKGLDGTRKNISAWEAKLADTKKFIGENPNFPHLDELLKKKARLTEVNQILAQEGGSKGDDFDPDEMPVETVLKYNPNKYDPDLFKKSIDASRGSAPAEQDPGLGADAGAPAAEPARPAGASPKDPPRAGGDPADVPFALAPTMEELHDAYVELRVASAFGYAKRASGTDVSTASLRQRWQPPRIARIQSDVNELLGFIAREGRLPSEDGNAAEKRLAGFYNSKDAGKLIGLPLVCRDLAAACVKARADPGSKQPGLQYEARRLALAAAPSNPGWKRGDVASAAAAARLVFEFIADQGRLPDQGNYYEQIEWNDYSNLCKAIPGFKDACGRHLQALSNGKGAGEDAAQEHAHAHAHAQQEAPAKEKRQAPASPAPAANAPRTGGEKPVGKLKESFAAAGRLIDDAGVRFGVKFKDSFRLKVEDLLRYIGKNGRLPSGEGGFNEAFFLRRYSAACKILPGLDKICSDLASARKGGQAPEQPSLSPVPPGSHGAKESSYPVEDGFAPKAAEPGIEDPVWIASYASKDDAFIKEAGGCKSQTLERAGRILYKIPRKFLEKGYSKALDALCHPLSAVYKSEEDARSGLNAGKKEFLASIGRTPAELRQLGIDMDWNCSFRLHGRELDLNFNKAGAVNEAVSRLDAVNEASNQAFSLALHEYGKDNNEAMAVEYGRKAKALIDSAFKNGRLPDDGDPWYGRFCKEVPGFKDLFPLILLAHSRPAEVSGVEPAPSPDEACKPGSAQASAQEAPEGARAFAYASCIGRSGGRLDLAVSNGGAVKTDQADLAGNPVYRIPLSYLVSTEEGHALASATDVFLFKSPEDAAKGLNAGKAGFLAEAGFKQSPADRFMLEVPHVYASSQIPGCTVPVNCCEEGSLRDAVEEAKSMKAGVPAEQSSPQPAAPSPAPQQQAGSAGPLDGRCFYVKAGPGFAAWLEASARLDKERRFPPACAEMQHEPGLYKLSPAFADPSRGDGSNRLLLLRAQAGYWEKDPKALFFMSFGNARCGRPSLADDVFAQFGMDGAMKQEKDRIAKIRSETGVDLLDPHGPDGGQGGQAQSRQHRA